MSATLTLVIRTPHEVVLEAPVTSVRLPTETGLVGLRPGQEPLVLAVEPGLLVLRGEAVPVFAATAGGLLDARGDRAELLTPFAVLGQVDDEVLAELDGALALPSSELAARRQLAELEQRILRELGPAPPAPRGAPP